jgi:SulP family sulfate permease
MPAFLLVESRALLITAYAMNHRNNLLARIAPNLHAKPLNDVPWGDVSGALTGALASIPQTLALGLLIGGALGGSLIGVGMVIALMGSVVLGLTAAIFGGCPWLVAGPRASTLLVFTALIVQLSVAPALLHSASPALSALLLASMAVVFSGIFQVLLGAFQLGRMAKYVPFPVMAGFVNGSALLIILSQVCPAMGISEQHSLLAFISHIGEIKPGALLLSLSTAALMLLLPRWNKKLPAMPLAFIAGTLLYHLLASAGFSDALGGAILPPPEHYSFRFIGTEAFALLAGPQGASLLPPMLAAALSMAILSSLDTLVSTAATDEITVRRSDTGRQLVAEGVGNALSGLFGMAPGSGALARTKAALGGGMRTAAAPALIALVTLFVALEMGPLIALLSQAVMAGLLIALGLDLVDKWTLSRLSHLFKKDVAASARGDVLVVLAVVSTAALSDMTTAVGVGVLLSVLLFITQMARDPVRRSYRATALIPRIYGDLARQRSLAHYGQQIAVLEIEGVLFFGTVSELEARVEALVGEGVTYVVLDMRRVKHIDATGARALERIHARLQQQGGGLAIAHVDRERRRPKPGQKAQQHKLRKHFVLRHVWIRLEDFGAIATLGEERFLVDTDAAVAYCEKHLAAQTQGSPAQEELLAAHAPLMKSLNRSMLHRLRKNLTRAEYRPHEVVFHQGSAPDGAYFVASGRVDVIIDLPGTERKRRVQSLSAGSIFGEMALIDPQPRSASIVASAPAVCYHLGAEGFDLLKREQPDIAFALLNAAALIFAERLRATNRMLAELEA